MASPQGSPQGGPISALLLIIITILIPPVGVFLIADCGPDLLINIILTILGYFPGHIHAFYLLFVYYDRRDKGRVGQVGTKRAPGVYSENIQRGGETTSYGTVAP